MYLSHFGLSEQPFADIPVTHCFYEGANRGMTLDALIYLLTHGEGVEGIIKVTGQIGSGKTILCRLLMRRLPLTIKTIYFDKPNLPQEELFQSIASALKFELVESCIIAASPTAAICELQNALIEQYAGGKQVVLLLDKAHTMPLETLEALRLLYDLDSSRHKLLQIVLFGQPELKNTLALPQMRQFKDRITHDFAMQPFNPEVVKEYLIFCLRAAGYRGPGIFTPEAVNLITRASDGLARRINNLADKSLLAAFIAHTRDIEAEHVEAAINDLGITQPSNWRKWSKLRSHRGASASAALAVVGLSVLGWYTLRSGPENVRPAGASVPVAVITSAPVSSPMYSTVVERSAPSASPPAASVPEYTASHAPVISPLLPKTDIGTVASTKGGLVAATEQPSTSKSDIGGVKLAGHSLLEQRVDATKKVMVTYDNNNSYSIQLFTTENIQPDRMERFLIRAQNLINVSDLYVHPVNNDGQAKFRVTYGIYPSREQASMAMDELPQKYKTSFHPELYTLAELR
ncbi:MAG: AAA family ATPase [Pseudomonadota bacterium]|nr:AAA family ATPase [Pseudomonadota bacterium]